MRIGWILFLAATMSSGAAFARATRTIGRLPVVAKRSLAVKVVPDPVSAGSTKANVSAVFGRHTLADGVAVQGVNLRSRNQGTLGTRRAGVHGTSAAGYVGVLGESHGGVGVVGVAKTNRGAGVLATAEGPGGTALQINNGAIRVGGAGIGSRNTPVFVHQAHRGTAPPRPAPTAESTAAAGALAGLSALGGPNRGPETLSRSYIDHPLTNGDPDAILFVVPRFGALLRSGNVAVGYDRDRRKWFLDPVGGSIVLNGLFNVLVIKR